MAGVQVLVIDDDPVIVRLLQVNFDMEGFEVVTAADGEEGLRLARQLNPDVVVCDVMMPKVNGLEVVEGLKGDPATRHIPVILVSARAQSSEVQSGLDVGADDYVTKPFDPLDLVERVNAALSKPSR
jgi:DNA-binding response OmpR family regulator